MRKQTAVLVQHKGEWVLVVDDDDETERVWEDFSAAMADLPDRSSAGCCLHARNSPHEQFFHMLLLKD